MKKSKKPTAHILVKTQTDSEWDNCEFAIIYLSEAWRDQQRQRLKLAELFQGDNYFQCIQYYDPSADFFKTDDEDQPNLVALLGKEEWIYVELDEGELEAFSIPENRIDGYTLVIHADGTALYKAYGKYTNEEFWTEEFSLYTLCMPLDITNKNAD